LESIDFNSLFDFSEAGQFEKPTCLTAKAKYEDSVKKIDAMKDSGRLCIFF
jgi:hypothetical protein